MNISKYKHFIWDWNGTLLNDTWLCVEITNNMLKRRNIHQITYDQYSELFDFPVIDYYRRLGFDLNAEPFETIGTEFITEYESRRFECDLQSKTFTVLQTAQNSGAKQSILSAYEHKMLSSMVKHFNVFQFFSNVKGLDDYSASSKIDNGKELLESLPQNPDEVLLIGDTVHDYEVAKSLGTNCLLVANGHHKEEKLSTCGVEVVDSLNDVLGMFEI